MVNSVHILHLEKFGYGPTGSLTRLAWREECLQYFKLGNEVFLSWQISWQALAEKNKLQANFATSSTSEDGTVVNKNLNAHSYLLDFEGHIFDCEINAKEFVYLQDVSFCNATFMKDAFFSHSIFKGSAKFEEVTFFNDSSFDNVIFEGDAQFNSSKRGGMASFMETTFLGLALFENAIFSNNAVFFQSTFKNNARFSNCSFFGVTQMVNTTFEAFALFNNATFFEDARFKNAIFKGFANFQFSFFKKYADFQLTRFQNQSLFEQASFAGRVDFENAHFDYIGHFEGAKFNFVDSKIPAFRGVKIDSTRLEFSDDTYFTQADFSENAKNNISFLKRLADEHGQTDQALNFNAMELRAKRKLAWQDFQSSEYLLNIYNANIWRAILKVRYLFNGIFWYSFVTYLYEHMSDFGRSFTRPLFYLVLLFSVSYLFGIVSAFEHSPAYSKGERQPIFSELSRIYHYPNSQLGMSAYRAASEYSLYRSGNFLDFTDLDKKTEAVTLRLFSSKFEPWWARVYGVIKGILSTALLFLIALGVRNKYRVG